MINFISILISSSNQDEFRFIDAPNVIELLNIIKEDVEYKVRYIFLGENIEDLNGSEAVKIIRNLENRNKSHSYNIVSTPDDDHMKKKILEEGFDSMIQKPC